MTNTSLLRKSVIYGQKSFITFGPAHSSNFRQLNLILVGVFSLREGYIQKKNIRQA